MIAIDVVIWCWMFDGGAVLFVLVETFYVYNFCFYLLFIVLLFVSMIEIS